MEKLSLKRYGWKCVLGSEVAYTLCIIGGFFPWRTTAGEQLHRTLLETMPGFTWISVNSVILGAMYLFIFSWIFACYMVWMYNTSLVK